MKVAKGDFPGGLVVKNLPSNAVRMSSISGRGTKTPHAPFMLFNRSVMSDSLQPRGLQHVRLPCP